MRNRLSARFRPPGAPGRAGWLAVARWLALAAAAGLLLIALFLLLMIQTSPIVQPGMPVSPDSGQARQMLHHHLRLGTGDRQTKHFVLSAADLSVAAQSILARKRLNGATQFRIDGERLNADVSIRLPDRFPRGFLNIHLVADNGHPLAIIKRLRIGRLSIPAPLIGWVVKGVMHWPPLDRYGQLMANMLREVHITGEELIVTVNWNREMLTELRGLLTAVAGRDRMLVYYNQLGDVLNLESQNRFIQLGKLMQPLFALAQQRSSGNHEPVEENRAAILVLTAYANGKNLGTALDTARQLPRRNVLLNKRIDTAKHFLGAAAMAMSGQGALVELIGLAKELHDTHDGSGFSFNDLAADEAGALFGKSAVSSADMARRVQALLSQSGEEAQYLPILKDLPESMDTEAFTTRFKTVDSPEYLAMKEQIRARIKALPLYRPL